MSTAYLLGRAFIDDPLMRYVLPDDSSRQWKLSRVFDGAINACKLLGGVKERYDGVAVVSAALWLPLRKVPLTWRTVVRSGIVLAPLFIGPIAAYRMARHESLCERYIDEIAPENCAYIWIVGVEPERVREGLGRSVVDLALLDMANQGYTSCILKTENENNLIFYSKLGFKVISDFNNPFSNLNNWIMKKEIA